MQDYCSAENTVVLPGDDAAFRRSRAKPLAVKKSRVPAMEIAVCCHFIPFLSMVKAALSGWKKWFPFWPL
jgi:hypothetical protein